MNKKSDNLGLINVALMYVSVIMGAGFASGREIWQFFGVFGEKGKIGVLFVAALFIFYGIATAYIARTLNTNDMGRIIIPGNNKFLISAMGYFMAGIIFTDLITMTAAASSLLNQQLNIPADELTERFIRGDVSRSTEGSGLGLSIAKSLTELQGGKFDITIDGDLFKVVIKLPLKK